jgi:hypothetical protein
MSVEEAGGFFTEKAVRPMLGALADVGLGYLRLGQPLTTLSGRASSWPSRSPAPTGSSTWARGRATTAGA